MSDTTTSTTSDAPALSGARAGVFTAFRYLMVLYLVLLLVQVFLAGLGIFGADVAATEDGATELDAHRNLGHILTTPVAAVLLVLALIARPGRRIAVLTVGWAVLGVVQVFLGVAGADAAFLGGLHALNALLYLGLTAEIVRRANPGLLKR